jgi:hypothetical protein
MEVYEAIRLGYLQALVGNVSVPVYSEGSIPENVTGSYVIISAFTSDQRFTDSCKVFEVTQMLDIVTQSLSPSGFGTANSIANLVENIVNNDNRVDIDLTPYGYKIGNTFTIQSNNTSLKDSDKYVYRVIKRYRHLISKQ